MLRFIAVLVFGLVASSAQAEEKLVFAPAPAWVKPAQPYASKAESGLAGVRFLLIDRQVAFGPAENQFYIETHAKVETSLGLGTLGAVQVAWEPETQGLTVHKVHIVRGGKVIDVLAKQTFAILRRETELESSMLDGVLTASLQPEGLEVGDIIDVAYTVTQRDPILAGKSEYLAATSFGDHTIDHARVRAVWPASEPIRWWTPADMEAAKPRRSGEMTELTFDLRDLKPIKPPAGAPARYGVSQQIEFTEFSSWAEVSALFAPLYDKAAQLPSASPLKAEVARIRAASSDPKVQAELALALVQEQVRYVFQAMDNGRLIPAGAEVTWTRRFGDCKGKTALLLALLKELGIQAQPAAVHTSRGDGMDTRLPRVGAFNHVLVRATIGGRDYWLDGTRSADGALDDVLIPPFRWALPIQAEGGALVRLQQAPADRPTMEATYHVDASAGIDAPSTVRVVVTFRGDAALMFGKLGAVKLSSELEKQLRANLGKTLEGIEIKSVSADYDPKTREQRFTVEGVGAGSWAYRDTATRNMPLVGSEIGWQPTFEREPGPGADAPFAIAFPYHTHASFTVMLPRGGVGFSLDGGDVEAKAGGWVLSRKTGIEGGVARVDVTVRSLAPEFPASEAAAVTKAISEAAKPAVVLRAPRTYQPTEADIAALAAKAPKTAQEFLKRGNAYMDRGEIKLALADFEQAVVLDPKSASALAHRGLARTWNNDLALAKLDLAAAAKLDSRDVVAVHGQALLAEREGRRADALAAYSRAVDLKVGNGFALRRRAALYWAMGEAAPALADTEEVLRLEPAATDMRMLRVRIYRAQQEPEKALVEAEASAKSNPEARVYRAAILAELGRKAESHAAFAEAIAAQPSVEAYLTRAKYRDLADRAGRSSDIEAALKLDPKLTPAHEMRAKLASETGDHARALDGLNQALKLTPDNDALLVARATAQVRAGRSELALKDFARVRERAAGKAAVFNNLCWTQATLNVALEAALADCDAALKLAPNSPAVTDSRAFVNLRLGRLEAALADYDTALKMHAGQGSTLYGRGIVKLRMGQTEAGKADLAAGRALHGRVDQEYAEYGITP